MWVPSCRCVKGKIVTVYSSDEVLEGCYVFKLSSASRIVSLLLDKIGEWAELTVTNNELQSVFSGSTRSVNFISG